jgi:predicted  nucleic acid-binding Zn-ribbon protein
MSVPRLTIRNLVFTGTKVTSAELEFDDGCNLVWGASDTGKSFTLEAIDFMLGGAGPLPDIEQLKGYETIWFGFTIEGTGDFTASRAVAGGSFSLSRGLLKANTPNQSPIILGQKHDQKKDNTLSSFLLEHLGFSGKMVAKDTFGEKNNLTFRHLANILLVDETAIQAKRSPIEKGQRSDKPLEHSVFRLLLSGDDDSAIIPVENPKKTKASKTTKLELLDEMIAEIDVRLEAQYPDIEEFADQDAHLTETLETIQAEFDAAQESIRTLLKEKQSLATDIPKVGERLDEIEIHLERFAQLDRVYTSDMDRLETLEEVGFLISLRSERDCPLCGASPEAQLHPQGMNDLNQIRVAATAEINKIKLLRADLKRTVTDLGVEQERLQQKLPKLQERLVKVEGDIANTLPKVDERRRSLGEVLAIRDRVRAGLALREQKIGFLFKRTETDKIKSVSKKDKPKLDLSGTLAQEFCNVVSRVLTKWDFLGPRRVTFDEKTYDLRIDGKLRVDHGKGVRAVTHAAFKVALLIFCHERSLPHPGFVVLDTPLMTYRDPIKNPKHGKLLDDEKALAQTTLKQKFFEHLYSIRGLGQFIIFENVDLPDNIVDLSKVETFHGGPGGRMGLFPTNIGT